MRKIFCKIIFSNFSLALSKKNIVNLISATLTAIVACIFVYLIYLLTKRILDLKRDKQIHEYGSLGK